MWDHKSQVLFLLSGFDVCSYNGGWRRMMGGQTALVGITQPDKYCLNTQITAAAETGQPSDNNTICQLLCHH